MRQVPIGLIAIICYCYLVSGLAFHQIGYHTTGFALYALAIIRIEVAVATIRKSRRKR
jgi:hypothetical protein